MKFEVMPFSHRFLSEDLHELKLVLMESHKVDKYVVRMGRGINTVSYMFKNCNGFSQPLTNFYPGTLPHSHMNPVFNSCLRN